MAGLLDSLMIGGGALGAHQYGVQITGHNIANSATEGYHRQEVVTKSMRHNTFGVRTDSVRRSTDLFLSKQISSQSGQTGQAQTRADALGRLESTVGSLDDFGLSSHLDRFFSAFRELAASPHDVSHRNDVVRRTEQLAEGVQSAAVTLKDAQEEADLEIVQAVDEINEVAVEVAQLNHQIAEDESFGQQANELHDQRDMAIARLGELAGITHFFDDKGNAHVMVGRGLSIVSGTEVYELQAQGDPDTGMHNVVYASGQAIRLEDRLDASELSGYLQLRDRDIADRIGELDQFASDFATAINARHEANFDANGDAGEELIVAPTAVAGAAINMEVNSNISDDSSLIAAAVVATGAPGDGRGAQAIADIDGLDVAQGSTKRLTESVNEFLVNLGYSRRDADRSLERNSSRLDQLENLRETTSGVSLEEQMIQLNRYQRAFQAASRVVSTVDDLLGMIMNL